MNSAKKFRVIELPNAKWILRPYLLDAKYALIDGDRADDGKREKSLSLSSQSIAQSTAADAGVNQ